MGSIRDDLSEVTIIGAGTQGRRLAHMWSRCGEDVHLIDQQPSQLAAALEFVETLRRRPEYDGVKWGQIVVHQADDIAPALRNSWLAIETVPERVDMKRKVIALLDRVTPPQTIIASNSSSHTIAELIDGLELNDSRRILSAHTYWPPETPAIEIMGHDNTEDSHIQTMMAASKAHGFEPFHVRRSSPGYIYNRIWAAIKRESLLVAAEGIAQPEEVDQIFKSVLKTPTGPFQQMDIVGLDVVLDIEENYARTRGGIPTLPREYLANMISDGRLGVKSGAGFYDYDPSGAKGKEV